MTEESNKSKMSRRKFVYVGGAVVAAAAIGGAYYLSQPPPPTPTLTPTLTATTTVAPSTTAVLAENVIFTQVVTEELQSCDPMFGGGGGDFSQAINTYDRLFRPTIKDGVEQPEPFLVTDYKTSADAMKWTMSIRQGVMFHDLTEMTAEDVAWSFDRYLLGGWGYSSLYLGAIEPGMTKALDKYTVEFSLKKPFGAFPATLCRFYVLNKKLVLPHIDEGKQGHDWLHTNEAGSGPYMLKEWRPREEVVLVKFDKWWGWGPQGLYEVEGKRRVTEYHFRPVVETATMKTMLISGQAEMDDGWMGTDAYKSSQGQGQVVLEKNGPWILERVLSMNNQVFPYDDIHVRKAVSWAFDYEGYRTTLDWDAVQAQGPVPLGLWGHNPDVFQYHQDMVKAKEELALSKYKPSELAKPIPFLVSSDANALKALFYAKCLEPIGMNVKPQMATWASILGSYTGPGGDPEKAPTSQLWGNTVKYPSPEAFLYSPFHSSQMGTWQGQAWYKNTKVDALLEEARSERDQNKVQQLYYQAQEAIVEDAPMVWLCNPWMYILRQPWVKGFTFRSTLGEYMYLPTFTVDKH